ncbi:hypothetical protein M8J77_018006 [Diaphorina citri]|nr:hypothetical protein M8J77_018006 [Diaphorina citri]
MVYPHSVGTILKILEWVGFTNHSRCQVKWKNILKTVYFVSFHFLCIISLISHLLSTTTRSIRYLPEFFQRLMEDISGYLFYVDNLLYIFRYKELQSIVSFMETSFCTTNRRVVRYYYRRGNLIMIVFALVHTIVISGTIIETYFPVSEKELELLRYVYQRKYPERRLQTNFWFPFIDDSESWYYEVIFYAEFYLIFIITVLTVSSICLIPMLITYTEGQYTMLSHFVEKIGQPHLDKQGRRIMYTNLIRNEYVYVASCYERGKLVGTSSWIDKEKVEHLYEKSYCRQIVRFHQMLIQFQEKIVHMYSPFMLTKMILNNTVFALCMYQVSTNPADISRWRVFKLISEFVGVALELHLLCHSSERLDDCHARLRCSLVSVSLSQVSPRVKRSLCMLVRRGQRPNQLRFYQGALVISHSYFMHVVKFSYTFVNFMRLRSIGH